MESSTEEVGLRLPVFLRTLPDKLRDEWPSSGDSHFVCDLKSNGISIVADVLSYALPLGLAWQPDWWQISVVILRKIVFPQLRPIPYIGYNFQGAMITAVHEIEAVCRFQSSSNPMVSNYPSLSFPPSSHPLPVLTPATQARQIPAFRAHQ